VENNDSPIIENELKKLGYWNNLYAKDDYFGTGQTILADLAKSVIEQHEIKNLLEMGCGQGRDSIFFASFMDSVTSFDISEKAIKYVEKIKNQRNLSNLELFVHDIRKPLDLSKRKFQMIYSNLALQFFDESQLEKIFENISDIMEKDSFLLFSTKKSGDKYHNFGTKLTDQSFEYKNITRFFFEKEKLENILEKQFSIISFEDDSHINPDKTVSAWWKILVKN
tara:strand:+ start:198 stop:869 length:672 start_codon:yes stop_codon:yes gene_type:complete